MAPFAFVTLVTSDSYLPGALVTAHSVRETEGDAPSIPFDLVCLVTPATVGVETIKALRQVFSLVVGVEEIRSNNQKELNLLGRQDLGSTLTKLHLWRLVQYQRVIYLDADTLVLRPISSLFTTAAPFSASPDSGWPDCFNSGVMVLSPSTDSYEGLQAMAKERGSWDGGDQGLLNDYFPNWNRLSFTYNVTPSAYYTYTPAYRRHGSNISVVHFIGQDKPWHRLNRHRSPGSSEGASDYSNLVDRWFDVYERAYGPVATAAVQSSGDRGTFKVPVYAAAWDANRFEAYVPPSTDQLKAMFTRSGTNNTFQNPQLQHASRSEGAYLSLPLPGRPSLIPPPPAAENRASASPSSSWSDHQSSSEPSIPQSRHPHRHGYQSSTQLATQHLSHPPSCISSSSRSKSGSVKSVSFADHSPSISPPSAVPSRYHTPPTNPAPYEPPVTEVWDAARGPPPKTGHQMSVDMTQRYDAAWDMPDHEAARKFFQPPNNYGSIPNVTHQDYSQVMSKPNTKSVFPWDEGRQGDGSDQRKATRVFPQEFPPPPPAREVQQETETSTARLSPPSSSRGLGSLKYANAWDDNPHIQRYATQLSSSSRSRSNADEGEQGQHQHQSSHQHSQGHGHGSSHSRHGSNRERPASESTSPAYSRRPGSTSPPAGQDRSGADVTGRRDRSNTSGSTTGGFTLRRESDASSRDGDDEDDESDNDKSIVVALDDGGERTPDANPKQTQGLSQLERRQSPPPLTGLPARSMKRPGFARIADGSFGSASRLPTIRSIIVGIPLTNDAGDESALLMDDLPTPTMPVARESPKTHGRDLGIGTVASGLPTVRSSSSGSSTRSSSIGASTSLPTTTALTLPASLPARTSTPTLTVHPPVSAPTRVFSPSTDPMTLKQNGLDALKRFVEGMERNQQTPQPS